MLRTVDVVPLKFIWVWKYCVIDESTYNDFIICCCYTLQLGI